MQVALKIWRYDAVDGRARAREYEIDAPEEATLLDCLDIVKDRVDGSLAYRKSCRMMICGSCGMRMDGARRARLQDADVRDRAGRSRPGDLGDGEPPDREGPRRRHGALLGEDPRGSAVARARLRRSRREGARRLAGADGRDPQGVALHHVRLLRLRVQLDGGRPRLPRPGGAREGHALRRRPARPGDGRAAAGLLRASTGSGTARAATSATSAARRASTRATRSRSSAPRR